MRILITGARGFLGGSVARFAAAGGHEVLTVSRGSSPAALTRLCDDFAPDAVLHAAGKASVGASFAAPREDFDAAALTWLDLLEAVRKSRHRPTLLLPSSAAVYGNPPRLPVAEDAPTRPISPYGFHKLATELLAEEYAACFGLDVVVARLFSVFGPDQRRLLVWELFEQLSGPDDTAWIQGTGRETRDFLHVDDVAAALLGIAAARAGKAPAGHAEIVNVASGDETTVLDLAGRVRACLGSDKPIACRGVERPGDPSRWRADVARLGALLGDFRPRPLAAGLAACVEAWRAARA